MLVTCLRVEQHVPIFLLAYWFLLDLLGTSGTACQCIRLSFSLHLGFFQLERVTSCVECSHLFIESPCRLGFAEIIPYLIGIILSQK